MRRFTRLTNAFSKKVGHHEAAVAFTPAMEARVSDHVWAVREILALL